MTEMISVFHGNLISGGLMATGSAALLLAVWIAVRLRFYRSGACPAGPNESSDERGDESHIGRVLRSTQIERVCGRGDFDFLVAQRGYTPEIGARLRRDRERIFRLYLRELAGEFHLLHGLARGLAASAPESQSSFVRILMRQQCAFWLALLRIELNLSARHVFLMFVSRPGLVNVEIGPLLECIDALRIAGRRAAPVQS